MGESGAARAPGMMSESSVSLRMHPRAGAMVAKERMA